MMNYVIWQCGNADELLIEIFNENNLIEVQKEFISKEYIIVKIDYAFDSVFMRIVKKVKSE